MRKKYKWTFLALLILGACWLTFLFLSETPIAMLNPKGEIAEKQRDLLIITTAIMLIVVIPVFILTVFFAWKYRESNKKATYAPEWDTSILAESIWWGIPFVIIIVLSVITWKSCVELDPFKPLESDKKPVTIEVVALQWNWLFIYPEQGIATLNFFQFPEQTPIAFKITADAPMNSFWIPDLGGQIYAMAGMESKLHLIANESGSFRGCSSNLSGDGFAGMTFTAIACSESEFNTWVESVKHSPNHLDASTYNQLAKPSQSKPAASYSLETKDLYHQILMKYMMPDMQIK